MDSGKVMTDIELLKVARKSTSEYVDMGHFRNPNEAVPYLIDGFQRGYRHAEKEFKAERDGLKEDLRMVRESQERQRQLNDKLTLERDELKGKLETYKKALEEIRKGKSESGLILGSYQMVQISVRALEGISK